MTGGRLARVSALLNSVAEGAALWAVLAMLVLVLWQVFTRYVLNAAPNWSEELARHCMVWAGLLGATSALYHRADPKLLNAIAMNSASGRWSARLGRLTGILLFLMPLLIHAPSFLGRHLHRVTESLGLNSAVIVGIVPLTACILLVHVLAQTRSDVGALRR